MHVQIASLAESIRLRTEDVGKELSEATALFNFGPVRKYLIPNDASDQRQIDKCNARLQSVARCVQAMVRTAQDVLSSPADFTDRFDKLKIARQDVGDLLPGVDIEAELAAMKDRAWGFCPGRTRSMFPRTIHASTPCRITQTPSFKSCVPRQLSWCNIATSLDSSRHAKHFAWLAATWRRR